MKSKLQGLGYGDTQEKQKGSYRVSTVEKPAAPEANASDSIKSNIQNQQAELDTPQFSAEDIASLFKISLKSVYRWIKSGQLPHFRNGNIIRIKKSDLQMFASRYMISPDAM